MFHKRSWIVALLLIAALVFTACAAPAAPAADAPADEGATEASDEMADDGGGEMDGEMAMDWENVDPTGQTVTYWHQHTRTSEESLNEIVADFNANNEYGITVNAEYQGGYDDIFNKMLNVVGTEDAPNLVAAYQANAATYQLADALLDIQSLVESEKWGLADEELADFFPGLIESDVSPTFGNALLGFPPNRSMEVMYYNSDWLAELGFDAPPATPEEFKEMTCAAAANPFSGATGDAPSMGYALGIGASTLASWVFAFGGDIFDRDAAQFTYNDPAAVESMQFLQDLINEGCANIVVERYGDQTDFGNGTLLFTTGTTAGIKFYKSAVDEGAGFEWSVEPLPRTTEDPVVNIYGASVSIPKSTPEAELATWLFIKHYTNAEMQAKWVQASNYFPVRKSVAEGLGDFFASNPAYETAFDLLQYSHAEPPVPGYDFVRDEAAEVMAAIADGAPVQEALDELTLTANEILADQMVDIE